MKKNVIKKFDDGNATTTQKIESDEEDAHIVNI